MGYDQYTCSWHCSCRTYFCCFPLALANIHPWPLLPFFEIYLKNSELKTTHNTFRDCRVHFFRQPFSKQLYTPVLFSLLLLFLLFVNPKNSKKQKQNNNNSSCKSLQQGAQKCDRFWFIHILLCRFNPIRIHLETVLNFWLVNVCVKECELIKGDHTFKLLAVMNLNRNWLTEIVKCYMNFQPNNVGHSRM